MNLFKKFAQNRRRTDVKDYLWAARTMLGSAYGKQEYYTPEQTLSVAKKEDLPLEDLRLVLVVYSTQEDYDAYQESTGLAQGYWDTRRELADLLFEGNTAFTQMEVTALITPPAGTSGALGGGGGRAF